MKNIIFVAGLCLILAQPVLAEEPKKETVRVCIDVQGKDGKPVLDAKTGKPRQDCKEMKKHKKYEGTKVPEKK